jgi:probable HAF family extracellular repeat protein
MTYRIRRRTVTLATALLLFGATTIARVSAQPSTELFRIIEVPGETEVFARGINNRGAIVGYASDANSRQGGFIAFDHFLGQINFPESLTTIPIGINDRGDIVGNLVAGNGVHSGFLLSKGQFTLFPDIGPEAINNRGDIVGVASGGRDGFLRSHGAFSTIRVPDSIATRAHGINDRGQIVGDFEDAPSHERGFLLWRGEFLTIEVPGSSRTEAFAINNSGQVVGKFVGAGGEQGFLWRGGQFTTISIPESVTTNVFGINDRGQIVGVYVDTSGTVLAFESHVRAFLEHR